MIENLDPQIFRQFSYKDVRGHTGRDLAWITVVGSGELYLCLGNHSQHGGLPVFSNTFTYPRLLRVKKSQDSGDVLPSQNKTQRAKRR